MGSVWDVFGVSFFVFVYFVYLSVVIVLVVIKYKIVGLVDFDFLVEVIVIYLYVKVRVGIGFVEFYVFGVVLKDFLDDFVDGVFFVVGMSVGGIKVGVVIWQELFFDFFVKQ